MRKSVMPVVFLALLSLMGAAPVAPASPPYAPEVPKWTGADMVGEPSVWGATAAAAAVWETDAGGDWDVVINTLRGANVTLPLGTSDQRHPALQDAYQPQYVFFEDDRAGNWDIYAYDLNELPDAGEPVAGSGVPIATGSGDQLDPAASGDWVVYEDDSRGNWDICAYNLRTKVRRRIFGSQAVQCDPAVSGNHVVFADDSNGNWDIYDYDLNSGRLRQLTKNRASQTKPQVGPGWAVYEDHRNGNWDIYACALGSATERRLTLDTADQTNPAIDGQPLISARAVVYQDARSGDADIYVYELTTRVTKRVTDDLADQTYPSISHGHVAWKDDRVAAPGIYGCHLQFPNVSLGGIPGTPAYNSTVVVGGSLMLSGAAYAGQRVYIVDRGVKRWATLPGPGSSFAVSIPNLVRRVTLRAVYPGDAGHLPTFSSTIPVMPKAYLTTPVLKRLPGRVVAGRYIFTADCSVTGYLKPRHTAGTRAVAILCYQLQGNGTWKYIKTAKVKVKDFGTYSKYSGIITLKGGPWRVKAVHSDADHWGTETGFSKTAGTSM